MEITASLVKQLRERTGAGMMECKGALVEAKGDLAEAEVVLRKKGIASASKKATRTTKQGVISSYIHPGAQLGVLIEVNCESDFVARTDDFVELVQDLSLQVATGTAASTAELLSQISVKDKATKIEDLIKSKIAKLGENIAVARFERLAIDASKHGVIASYIHPGAQLGVSIEVNTDSAGLANNEEFKELVHDLAMQIAAADPQFVRKEEVTQAALDKERDIQRARALAEGKPEKMVDKIVEGRLSKYFEEFCLYEQPFIKDNAVTINDMIKSKIAKLGENISVARFVRFKVGDTQTEEAAAE